MSRGFLATNAVHAQPSLEFRNHGEMSFYITDEEMSCAGPPSQTEYISPVLETSFVFEIAVAVAVAVAVRKNGPRTTTVLR